MITVTFKDVGQGDSIIIEWHDKSGLPKVGIIDCKKKGLVNPTLEHIKKLEIKEIDFLVISHPHSDHYSGFAELLDYCLAEAIKINKFCYTFRDIDIEFYHFFEPHITNSAILVDIFEKANIMFEKGLLEPIQIGFDYTINLTEKSYIKCLSPSFLETKEYLEVLKFEPEKNRIKRSNAANLLSTLFKLHFEDSYILFTSDVEKVTFNRILNKNIAIFDKKENVLSQIPHHGSLNNHEPLFWSYLSKSKKCEAVISVGKYKSYKHPNYLVIDFFSNLGYKISSTNIIYGMKEFVEKIKLNSIILDVDSVIDEDSYNAGDQVFKFD
jgi:beta-lactamase superfamily II metal-dependent hydrolase